MALPPPHDDGSLCPHRPDKGCDYRHDNAFWSRLPIRSVPPRSATRRGPSRGNRPNAVAIANERAGACDHYVALRQPFANFRLPGGEKADLHASCLDTTIANRLHHRAPRAVQHRGERNGSAATPADAHHGAAERTDPQPLITANEDPDLAKLRGRIDRGREMADLAVQFPDADDIDLRMDWVPAVQAS